MKNRSDTPGDLAALSPWAKELARTFVSLASDIALVLDDRGVIQSVAQGGAEPLAPGADQWVGRPWAETVSGDTRRKVELLLEEVSNTGLARKREVNHPSSSGADIPVAYTAIRLGLEGPVLAVGRDLRAIAAIQQRFLDAQQELERGYWKARQAESREALLQQVATDAVLVLDAPSLRIVGRNAVAVQRFGNGSESWREQPLAALFEPHSRGPVDELMATARGSGRAGEIRARLLGASATNGVCATPFRAGDEQRLLVRLREAVTAAPVGAAVAVTDSSGRLVSHDAAFAALLGTLGDLSGRPLAEWSGADTQELDKLLAEVRREGVAARPELTLRAGQASPVRVQLDASWLTEGDQEHIALTLRRHIEPALPAFAEAWQQIGSQLGRASLADMLREATVLAERHFIEAALRRAGGDEAGAAHLLGLSTEALARRREQLRAAPSTEPDALP